MKEIRVIYVTDGNRTYPLTWSESFSQFLLQLYEIFPYCKQLTGTTFYFRDGTGISVCVCNESTFHGLVPRHRQLAPDVNLYYSVLEKWIVQGVTK